MAGGSLPGKTSPLDIRRADAFETAEIHPCWSLFKSYLLSAQEQAIPKGQAGKAEGSLGRSSGVQVKKIKCIACESKVE